MWRVRNDDAGDACQGGTLTRADQNGKHGRVTVIAMMDPHTAAELDLESIWWLVDELIAAHGDWLPAWARVGR
jgi:alpha-galactosidase